MIIKMRTQENCNEGWLIIADVETVSYRVISKSDRQNERFHPDYYVQALDRNGRVDETLGMEEYKYITASLKEEGKYRTICSNMVVYLLNDEGKTVERLN